MPLVAYLLLEPWSLLHDEPLTLEFPLDQGKDIEIDALYRCLMVPDGTEIFAENVKISPDMQSRIFLWENCFFRRALLPIELWDCKQEVSRVDIKLTYRGSTFEFSLIAKVYPAMTESIKAFLRLQVERFQEIYSRSCSEEQQECEINNSLFRKSWRTAQKVWLEGEAFESESSSSYILKMARDKHLTLALVNILKTPNRVLKRERVLQNIAKAVEMDAACLHSYMRQPGRTLLERAGPKQKVLSICRDENYDVLENRLTKWVVEKVCSLTDTYLRDNERYSNSEKCNMVRKFSGTLKFHEALSLIHDISRLEHNFTPNTVLMQHRNYHIAWKAYRELRSFQKLEEECWKWQETLWCETVRQILGAMLTRLPLVEDSFTELAQSMIYVRKEQMHGFWTDPPIAPGPFSSKEGRIDYIDLRDGRPEKSLVTWMNALGCQQVLRQQRKDGREHLMPIWFWHEIADKVKLEVYLSRCLEAITISLPLLKNNDVRAEGIVFVSEMVGDCFTFFSKFANNTKLTIVKISRLFHQDVDSIVKKELLSFFN